MKSLKPGELAPFSAQFAVLGKRGGKTGVEITGVKGKPLPPTQFKGMSYIPVDKTKHKK